MPFFHNLLLSDYWLWEFTALSVCSLMGLHTFVFFRLPVHSRSNCLLTSFSHFPKRSLFFVPFDNDFDILKMISAQFDKTLGLQKEISTQINRIRSSQERLEVEAINQRQIQRQNDLLNWLGRATSTKHEDSLRTRLEGSGTWLLEREEYSNWIGSYGPSFFWLNGIRMNPLSFYIQSTNWSIGSGFGQKRARVYSHQTA